jgi:N-acetylneuraminic acid mutarotase
MYGALVTFRDRLWWISGSDGIGARAEIFSSSDGATWTQAGTVPVAAYNFGLTVFQDQLWLVGGNNNLGDVYRSSDGVMWTKAGSLPMSNHGGSLGVLGNQMIYAGGHNGSLFNWVLTSPDGATWTQVGTLPNPREYAGHVTINGRFYVFGGQDTVPTPMAIVSSTTDGTTWTAEPPLPTGRAFGPVLLMSSALWSIGGTDGGGVFQGSASGTWSTVSSTFTSRQGGGAALFSVP